LFIDKHLSCIEVHKEHVKGAADKAVGKTKEAAGHVTGNKKLETEGKVGVLLIDLLDFSRLRNRRNRIDVEILVEIQTEEIRSRAVLDRRFEQIA
jgi:hypothetical protein